MMCRDNKIRVDHAKTDLPPARKYIHIKGR